MELCQAVFWNRVGTDVSAIRAFKRWGKRRICAPCVDKRVETSGNNSHFGSGWE